MRIHVSSVTVDDQEKAGKFYTEVLGFKIKNDIPMGEHKWLTVTSQEDPDGVELLLEPLAFPPAKTYQQALYDAGIPATSFAVGDVEEDYLRLSEKGVKFTMKPTHMGPVSVAIFDDTCGNLIQLAQLV
jgi:predicted enzyme related to lactoylglutathione lyase